MYKLIKRNPSLLTTLFLLVLVLLFQGQGISAGWHNLRQIATGTAGACCSIFLPVSPKVAQPTNSSNGSGGTIPDAATMAKLGREVSVSEHFADGEEYTETLAALLAHGEELFAANWTGQEGGGRPFTKGTGAPLTDTDEPLTFPRNMNRISGPDSNSCAGCHNAPFGIPGGGGDFVGSVFVLGQRFDFVTFDQSDMTPTKGEMDENGAATTLQSIANLRATVGMFGSGYIEMLARQMTADLQAIRDSVQPGQSKALVSKGISFGTLSRAADGTWNIDGVEGLPSSCLTFDGPNNSPNLVIRPFHQAAAVVSLRQFTNNAYNHHHGIQTEERFGKDVDADGDGFVNELTRADVTAVTVYQAAMAVPGRVIPNDSVIEQAVWNGEKKFHEIGCTSCHVAQIPLDNSGWIYTEPNPYNPAGNLQVGQAPTLQIDLSNEALPGPRLQPQGGIVYVPAYTDFKVHDITSGPDDPNRESLNMHAAAGTEAFTAGNSYFFTRPLWGAANQPPYFHHGLFTTMRDATLAHAGEAEASRAAFEALSEYDQKSVIEFMKSLQILPAGTKALFVDENGQPREWPPAQW
ncbi:MAG: hypothetical protein KDE50_07880 [Caldilineaceae bacterium]|nr:hypothetical protein [Caldilineaceae bacterium]